MIEGDWGGPMVGNSAARRGGGTASTAGDRRAIDKARGGGLPEEDIEVEDGDKSKSKSETM
jgi:hypothetical protein